MGVDPALVRCSGEQVRVLYTATCRDIGIPPDQQGLGIGCAIAVAIERPPDFIHIVAGIAASQRFPYRRLTGGVRGRRIGLGHIERDFVSLERIEDRLGEVRETQAPDNKAFLDAKALGDLRRAAALDLDQIAKCQTIFGRRHLQPVIIFSKADFAAVLRFGKNKDGDLIIGRQRSLLDQAMDRIEAAATGSDAIMTFLTGDRHANEILDEPMPGDAGFEFSVSAEIGPLAHIDGRLGEMGCRDEDGWLGHATNSAKAAARTSNRAFASFPLSFRLRRFEA